MTMLVRIILIELGAARASMENTIILYTKTSQQKMIRYNYLEVDVLLGDTPTKSKGLKQR